jgi:hypothetical protein
MIIDQPPVEDGQGLYRVTLIGRLKPRDTKI